VGNTEELLPNSQLCCDSLAVRATSYALLVYTLRREAFVRPIVRWINTRSAILSTTMMFFYPIIVYLSASHICQQGQG
jgi:hypothetical protein